jgi:putative transposase
VAIDKAFTEDPTMGTRRMSAHLANTGMPANRKAVRRLYREMGIMPIYPKPRLSRPGKGHKIYPYLLKGLDISAPDQVWSTDITYLPMPSGHMYLMAVMDIYSRRIVAWDISNTMDVCFCKRVLRQALDTGRKPGIFNTDQGSQYTSEEFTQALLDEGIRISMDGKGRFIDNIFIERFWRTLKYDYLYIYRPEAVKELRQGLSRWIERYNTVRTHSSVGNLTPDAAYFGRAAA